MTNEQLDLRIRECVKVLHTIIVDLEAEVKAEVPSVDRAVVLGALLACRTTLTLVSYADADITDLLELREHLEKIA